MTMTAERLDALINLQELAIGARHCIRLDAHLALAARLRLMAGVMDRSGPLGGPHMMMKLEQQAHRCIAVASSPDNIEGRQCRAMHLTFDQQQLCMADLRDEVNNDIDSTLLTIINLITL